MDYFRRPTSPATSTLRNECDDHDQDNHPDNPSEDSPGLSRSVAALTSEFVRPASTMRDVDTANVFCTAQSITTLAACCRWGGTGITLRSCLGDRICPIRMTTLRAGHSLSRNLPATSGTTDKRHLLLRNGSSQNAGGVPLQLNALRFPWKTHVLMDERSSGFSGVFHSCNLSGTPPSRDKKHTRVLDSPVFSFHVYSIEMLAGC
jgi:hypothetical protein